MTSGNIVRWNGSIWIVAEVKDEWHGNEYTLLNCVLLSATSSNCSAHPSQTWPDDPEKRIDSIEVLASNLQDFLHTLMDNAIDQIIAIQED